MQQIESHLEKVLDGLKDFQRATVDHVFHRLFDQPMGRMLVADEVGLGKTIVAKGVIAKAVRRHLLDEAGRPFQVAYICSNQAIAQENQQKLQIFPEGYAGNPLYGRIAELAFQPETLPDSVLEINSLTPATSFTVTRGPGNWVERMIVYRLLEDFFTGYKPELTKWMRYQVGEESWSSKLSNWAGQRVLRSDLAERFRLSLEMVPANLSAPACIELALNSEAPLCLFRAVEHLLRCLRAGEYTKSAAFELRIQLRRALIECCIDYIDADLFILDEFQRFRALLEENGESEEARIANLIFSKPGARILLLSATPFKAYSGGDDQETGEAHYQELKKVLDFLAKEPENLMEFEDARREIYDQLARLGNGTLRPEELCEEPKNKLENLLNRYICRTERSIASGSGNLMVKDSWRQIELPFSKADIETFLSLDRLALLLSGEDLAGKKAGGILEYAKSAAFPLSYLDGYQFKEQLRKYMDRKPVQNEMAKTRAAWLNQKEINSYSLDFTKSKGKYAGGNARLAQLAQEAIGEKGHSLLWVPPSLPHYRLSGPFAGQEAFSKTLVFSCWLLVPKMIGTLLSYEVERRTIGRDKKIKPEDRKYFHRDKQPRHPRPQLKFRLGKKGKGGAPAAMSLFTLLFPSWHLADLVDAEFNGQPGRTFYEIKTALTQKIARQIAEGGIETRVCPNGKKQAWYWYAPFALDQQTGMTSLLDRWLDRDGGLTEGTEAFQDKSSLREHFQKVRESLKPEGIALGEMPDNLPEQLAAMALGSPAVACLRSLRRIYPDIPAEEAMAVATQLAAGFLELFNKPEAISAVRLAKGKGFFWQQVLDYAGRGCLHAMLDEYLHMLVEQAGSLKGLRVRFLNSINMFTASVNVESLSDFRAGKKRKMRCHYAVEMGNQKIETEGGQQRVINLRESFNSPFRPFVLASTSIGQEGLDFHWYCRRIVHWNLPGNPIDLEQREGRINRYKSLVIRRRIAAKYGSELAQVQQKGDVWATLMDLADADLDRSKTCQLQPFWHVEEQEGAESIERLVPIYPFSRDAEKLADSLRVLALYRLTFGQPRQQELLEFLLKRDFSEEELHTLKAKLLINLAPVIEGDSPASPDLEKLIGNPAPFPISTVSAIQTCE